MRVLKDAEYWRERAKQTREQAQSARDPNVRKQLLELAEAFEEVARTRDAAAD